MHQNEQDPPIGSGPDAPSPTLPTSASAGGSETPASPTPGTSRLIAAFRFYAAKANHEIARSECEVCGNAIGPDGMIEHGKGCYTQSEDGGGSSFEGSPVALDGGEQARAALREAGLES